MTLKEMPHPQRSRHAVLVCDRCDALIVDINDAFDIWAGNKPSHKLLLCKECRNDLFKE